MHVNSAIHPIVIASKTVTRQHGSSTVLQQVNDLGSRKPVTVLHVKLYPVQYLL